MRRPSVRGRERQRSAADLRAKARLAAGRPGGRMTRARRSMRNRFCVTDSPLCGEPSGASTGSAVRFPSPHPSDIDRRAHDALASEPESQLNLHLPLHIRPTRDSPRWTSRYTVDHYRALVVCELRRTIPRTALSTDIMLGFT